MKDSQLFSIKLIIAIISIIIGGVLLWRYATKARSPEDISVYSEGPLEMEVVYNRPTKRVE